MPWFPPLFLASRELRVSHARGHRLESGRDHPQNAATPVPFATFAGTNRTRHAHCLRAGTGGTRRGPDHRVTDLRSAAGAHCTLASAKISSLAVPIHHHGSFMA